MVQRVMEARAYEKLPSVIYQSNTSVGHEVPLYEDHYANTIWTKR